MNPRLLHVGAWLVAIASLPAQDLRPRESFVVSFVERSFDLTGLRQAVRSGVAPAALARLVQDLHARARADQAGFAAHVRRRGGVVTAHWWLINGCAIDIAAGEVPALRRLPNVAAIEADRVRRPHLVDATDNLHHGSASANRHKDGSGRFLTGQGVGVAVLDTGADVTSGTTNRPHACYYPDGDPRRNTNPGIQGSLLLAALKLPISRSIDDAEGHGTAVGGCVGGNRWNTQNDVGNGIAPGAGIVAMNITDASGLSKDSWIVTAWQTIVGLRSKHAIGVGNNSFSGAPDLSNVAQRALDSAAYHGDMVITVSAGNFGRDTADSQFAFNGLAVGALVKRTLQKAPTSAVGPLHRTARTYPDLTAVGERVVLPMTDQETGKTVLSGTSFAAPMVAGAAALVRQAAPRLDANAVRAILLNTAAFRTADRNAYGLGSLRADAAVAAALRGDVVRGTVTAQRRAARFPFRRATAGTHRVTVTWMRADVTASTTPDLTLRIYDDQQQLVAIDKNPDNSYESVRFSAAANRSYHAEVYWANAPTGNATQAFAIAGATSTAAPTLAALLPDNVTAYKPGTIEIAGQGLATTTAIRFGTIDVTDFVVFDDTRLRVAPPTNMPIGPVAVQVRNPHGASASRTLRVTAPADPIFVGPGPVTRGSGKHPFAVHSGRSWRSLVLVSDRSGPSRLGNIYDLGIGDRWMGQVLPLFYLSQDPSGAAKFELDFPATLPKVTLYLQAISTNPNAIQYPFPASNVLTLVIR